MTQAQEAYKIDGPELDEPKTFEDSEAFHSTVALLDEKGIDYEVLHSPENGEDTAEQAEPDGGDNLGESETDTDETVVPEFEDRDGPDAEPESVEVSPTDVDVVANGTPENTVPQNTLQDPLDTLPEWMKSEIQHGTDTTTSLNKRGSQVIANALNLVVEAECEIAAHETGFEYSRYRATVTTPDGETYNAVGDAHIDESKNSKWDLERMAETRAKKRAVKWATGGGIQGFVESQ